MQWYIQSEVYVYRIKVDCMFFFRQGIVDSGFSKRFLPVTYFQIQCWCFVAITIYHWARPVYIVGFVDEILNEDICVDIDVIIGVLSWWRSSLVLLSTMLAVCMVLDIEALVLIWGFLDDWESLFFRLIKLVSKLPMISRDVSINKWQVWVQKKNTES